MPFSSLASTASSSNAMRVPRASWSNASKAWDDFKDSFDRINDVDSVSSDDVAMFASNSISYNGLAYRSDGGTWSFTTTVGGVVDLPSLGGDVYYTGFYLQLGKPDLPSYGKYNFSFSLFDVLQNVRSAGVDNVSADYFILADEQKNVSASFVNSDPVTVNKSSNAWTAYGTLSISGKTSVVGYRMNFYNDVKLRSIKFKLLDVSVTYSGSNSTVLATSPSSNNQDSIGAVADAANALVDKQDTIIDQIVDTTQTISNQLYSFWNQLAGEFTNLYNKMNQQHVEKLQSDQDTRDTITEESEKSRNFIVDGIINGLKSLFIPSDDYFKAWFDDMYAFFNDRFGFLMFPVDLLVQMVNLYLNADSSFAGVPFPEFKWIDGTVVIPAQNVQFTFLETDWGQGIQQKLYFVGNIIMIGALLSLMHRKFEEVLRN